MDHAPRSLFFQKGPPGWTISTSSLSSTLILYKSIPALAFPIALLRGRQSVGSILPLTVELLNAGLKFTMLLCEVVDTSEICCDLWSGHLRRDLDGVRL